MKQLIEQQQGRFEKLTELLEAMCRYEHDSMSTVGRALLEESLTLAALGAEDVQIALDEEGDKVA